MKKIMHNLVVITLFTTIFLNIACSQESKTQTNVKNTTELTSTPLVYNVEKIIPSPDGKAINFSYIDNGKTRTYEDLTKGKVVLLNFWGTWCPPCRAEIPDIMKLYDEYKSKGLVVIGVATERNEERAFQTVSDFVIKNKLNYIIFPSREIANAYGKKFSPISAVPTTYIIDRDGNVVEVIVGMRDKATFESVIKKYL
jgi:thiol-disulfide isomerase/thioredoxin